MPRTAPTHGFPTLADYAEAMVEKGWSDERIAKATGRSAVSIRATLSARRYAKGPRTIVLPMELYRALAKPALARGIDAPTLAVRILEQIAEDDAFDALLDDAEGGQDG